jgi:biotin synthase
MSKVEQILEQKEFTSNEIVYLLQTESDERQLIFEKAASIREQYLKNEVYLRGLIEFSNYCIKNCYYCGIRKSNINVIRFILTDEEIFDAARYAYQNKYGSIVLQSGELRSTEFTNRVTNLLQRIHELTDNKLRITLSSGEQDIETYRHWFKNGASRYLLRIETTSRNLYSKIHPYNELHSFDKRLKCIYDLKQIGYQVGSGVMIGLPFQSLEELANDLLWMKKIDIDMVGMGPYLEHKETPFYRYKDELLSEKIRFDLSLKMIAILRILMNDVNIAASTAMQSIDKFGREKAINAGANVFMPNITPIKYRENYKLYDNKPCSKENPDDCKNCIETRIALTDSKIAYEEWGDSLNYQKRKQKNS